MSRDAAALTMLRRLIGRRVRYQNTAYTVLEILDDGPALVLEPIAHHSSIQTDNLGYPRREMPATITVSVAGEDGQPDLDAAGLEVI